ncbi:ribonucleotide reductase subunit 1 [Panine betaherpesvirus 2]|uniref:Ribonucleotide reductase subunit 1 n=1 Tax=Panine betaherpesvirus 2 TaxID=188763 RepID=Q8QS44_9BETA|nr:ribonucleotide reductase subunit 1 [Panine betaherpesvirus 2]AAM00694.1 ribonucleotide reductase subunit 1 [Panine betaherpesvirus 2]QXV67799.1 ribonucleotide reductase subunit 1 [Panine betaherpesvirus 2]
MSQGEDSPLLPSSPYRVAASSNTRAPSSSSSLFSAIGGADNSSEDDDDSEIEEGPLSSSSEDEAVAGHVDIMETEESGESVSSSDGVRRHRPSFMRQLGVVEEHDENGDCGIVAVGPVLGDGDLFCDSLLSPGCGGRIPVQTQTVSSSSSPSRPVSAPVTCLERDGTLTRGSPPAPSKAREDEEDFGASLCKISPVISAVRAVMGKKCHCHGYWGRFRFCGVQEPVRETVGDRTALWREIDALARHGGGLGSFRLFQMVMRHGPSLIHQSPRTDLLLGRFYIKANWPRESRSPLSYASELCDDSLRRFVLRHADDLPRVADETYRFVELAGCWGLYPAILCLDKICRQLHGQDECLGGVFIRVAASVTAAIEESLHSRIYRFLLNVRHEAEVLEAVLRRCRDGQLSLSTFAMSTVGFDKMPCYDFLISADSFARDAGWAAMCKWMSSLSCGVSVSINVTRLDVDATSVIRCLGGYCDLVREREVHRPVVRFFVDLWDVAAIRVINHILKECTSEPTGVCYAFNVPSLLMKRYRGRQPQYCLFGRAVARRLSDLGHEAAFDREYRRCEESCPKVTVNTEDFLKKVLVCALRGRASVVFIHHVVKYSMLACESNLCLPACLSPDMASCHFGEYDAPVQRLMVNLSRCVFARSEQHEPHSPDVVLGNTRRYFDLRVLRELVTEAVIWGNARLDALVAASDWWVENAVDRLRPLHIGVVGLHTVLMRLGFTYFASWDLIERIFEHMYFAAVRASVDLCKAGLPRCDWFERTIYAGGKFIFELYRRPRLSLPPARWEALRADMLEHGMRNCQFLSVGPDDEVAHLWSVTPSVWAARDCVYDEETVWSLCPLNRECYFPSSARRSLRVPVVNYAWLEHQEDGKAAQCLFQRAAQIQNDVEVSCVNLSVFVDHCVTPLFYYDSSMTPDVLLSRMLKWYHLHLKVGVYKYCSS